mmetsp:Transcript_15651/g.31178  ORF Transcript_15651/g.31178 Transcript_15651/m.31178 type:complete len:371 (-) Transcript_15651:47-1159(-)
MIAVAVVLLLMAPRDASTFTFPHPAKSLSQTRIDSRLFSSPADQDDASKLMDEVARIRAEIAALEGKTTEQVETEAASKKADEKDRAEADAIAASMAAVDIEKVAPDGGRFLPLPEDAEDQIRQSASSALRATADGISRQAIRFALFPAEGGNLLEMSQWPGGAQQMYREAARPFTEGMVRRIAALDRDGGLPPAVSAKDLLDFDGSGIVSSSGPDGTEGEERVRAIVLANTDVKYIRDIQSADKEMGDRPLLLVNPFWRDIDSWGINIMAPGARKMAETVIFNRPYEETYALNRLDVRGEACAALKAYPYDWQLFAYIESDFNPNVEVAVRLGSTPEEPKSADFAKLINDRPEFKLSKNMRMMQRTMGK